MDAEALRNVEERQKLAIAESCIAAVPEVPRTLATLLEEFFGQHVDGKLAPKTAERYHEQAAYLDPALCELPIAELKPLHLSREWKRLTESGGHHRGTNQPRPLSNKTVRNIAGVVSSAFKRGIKWGLISSNPVSASEPPVPKKKRGIALASNQVHTLVGSATGPWCLCSILEMGAATGARRGEVLALRWSDIESGRVVITRSLSQTKAGLQFKDTKTEDSVRPVTLPPSTVKMLETHQKKQNEFRHQFGSDYRADLDLIFANPDGSPSKPDSVSASVSALCKRLKLPKGANLHALRHTHGSHLLAAGMEITAVSERLGHSSVRVTQEIYSHAIRGRDDEAAKLWDDFRL
jgi:integrase